MTTSRELFAPFRALRLRALEYAATLDRGAKIVDEIDGDVIAEFRHLLPAALALRGLVLVPLRSDVWEVRNAGDAP
jgi:hypothetical protein